MSACHGHVRSIVTREKLEFFVQGDNKSTSN